MERMTERDEFGNADIIGVDSVDLQCNLDFDAFNLVTEALNRLAAYEDTGLTPDDIYRTEGALNLIRNERQRQDSIWGNQSGHHLFEWMSILGEEYGELCEAVNETCFRNGKHPERGGEDKVVKEAVQVAAVATCIIECLGWKAEAALKETGGNEHQHHED